MYHPTVVQDRKKLQPTKVIASDNLPMEGTSALTFEIRTEPVSVQDYRFARILGQPPWELFKQFGAKQDAVSENYETFSHKYTIAKLGGYSNPTQTDVRTARPDGDWLVLFARRAQARQAAGAPLAAPLTILYPSPYRHELKAHHHDPWQKTRRRPPR